MTQWGLDTLFNPAKRHMDDEKRRLQTTREQLGDSSGGKRIDLESGKVRIAKTAEDEDAETDETGADAAGDAKKSEPKKSEPKSDEHLSDARKRAAARRRAQRK